MTLGRLRLFTLRWEQQVEVFRSHLEQETRMELYGAEIGNITLKTSIKETGASG